MKPRPHTARSVVRGHACLLAYALLTAGFFVSIATAVAADRPYVVAGPAGRSTDTEVCRRLAAVLNAEPADRDLAAPRADQLFARWQPNDPGDWRARLTLDPLFQVTHADILNEGQPRRVYRLNYPFVPYDPTQSLVFMRDNAEPLPRESRTGPSMWAEAFADGRIIDASNVLFGREDQAIQRFITRHPPAATAAGHRFGRVFRGGDAEDLVLLDDGRVFYLSVDTKGRAAMLAELRVPDPRPVCYLVGIR